MAAGKPRKHLGGVQTMLSLPDKPTEIDRELSHYMTFLYGREGVGKTTFFAGFPKAIFFAFEPGTLGLEVFEFFSQNGIAPSWEALREGIGLLEQEPERFATVVIDTGERAYEACTEFVCAKLGITHPSMDASGKRDRSGHGWIELRKEFTSMLYRIRTSRFGLGVTSHSRIVEVESASGGTFNLIAPTLSGQAYEIIGALSDNVFYVEFVKDAKTGETMRVVITSGDELVTAKHRYPLPRYLPFPNPFDGGPTGYDVFKDAFHGRHPGLDPASFRAGNQTAKPVAKSLLVQSTATTVKRAGEAKSERSIKALK